LSLFFRDDVSTLVVCNYLLRHQTETTHNLKMQAGGGDILTEDLILKQELRRAEMALAKATRTRQILLGATSSSIINESSYTSQCQADGSGYVDDPLSKLEALDQTMAYLRFSSGFADWQKSLPQEEDIFQEAQACERLANLMTNHGKLGQFSVKFFEEEYYPFFQYCTAVLQTSIRQELETNKYPSSDSCDKLIKSESFGDACLWLTRLENINCSVLGTFEMESDLRAHHQSSTLIKELFRPIVDRVAFPFVPRSKERITSTKTDRLPEIFFNYVRENFLEMGPWKLVHLGLGPKVENIELHFLNELVRMISWVMEKRNFFRHESIAGPHSNSLLLCNAIEQVLQFDSFVRQTCIMPLGFTEKFLGLFDTLIGPDEDLLEWWIQRERESISANFTSDGSTVEAINNISPRAEIFAALIRSVQTKASLMANPGPYLREVGIPLCTSFIDAIHQASVDLKQQLKSVRVLDNPSDLNASITRWIELIAGTSFATSTLLRDGAWLEDDSVPNQGSDHDLARFGRSLGKLQSLLEDEFAATYSDSVLMKHAKLANFLMIISSLISSTEGVVCFEDTSDNLERIQSALFYLVRACTVASKKSDSDETTQTGIDNHTPFAPFALQEKVVSTIVEKFVELLLDPALFISYSGACTVESHIRELFSDFSHMSSVDKLFEMARLSACEQGLIQSIKSGLYGLLGSNNSIIDFETFLADPMLHSTAEEMVAAKGFKHIALEEAISILNRRE
jgi:hypothetical protein